MTKSVVQANIDCEFNFHFACNFPVPLILGAAIGIPVYNFCNRLYHGCLKGAYRYTPSKAWNHMCKNRSPLVWKCMSWMTLEKPIFLGKWTHVYHINDVFRWCRQKVRGNLNQKPYLWFMRKSWHVMQKISPMLTELRINQAHSMDY